MDMQARTGDTVLVDSRRDSRDDRYDPNIAVVAGG